MYVYVNGFVWYVTYTHDPACLSRSDNTLALGVTDTKTKCVYIYDKLSPQMREKVLTHELCHVWIFSHSFYLSIEQEEFICCFVDTYARDIISEVEKILENTARMTV